MNITGPVPFVFSNGTKTHTPANGDTGQSKEAWSLKDITSQSSASGNQIGVVVTSTDTGTDSQTELNGIETEQGVTDSSSITTSPARTAPPSAPPVAPPGTLNQNVTDQITSAENGGGGTGGSNESGLTPTAGASQQEPDEQNPIVTWRGAGEQIPETFELPFNFDDLRASQLALALEVYNQDKIYLQLPPSTPTSTLASDFYQNLIQGLAEADAASAATRSTGQSNWAGSTISWSDVPIGSIVQVLIGGLEVGAGYSIAAGGGTVTFVSGGFSSPISVPAIAFGLFLGAHGCDNVTTGANNLFTGGNALTFTERCLDSAGIPPELAVFHSPMTLQVNRNPINNAPKLLTIDEGAKGSGSVLNVAPKTNAPASAFHRLENRSLQSPAKIKNLAADMKANGWQGDPISVFEHGGEKYILDGHHRVAAARQAGIDVPFRSIPESELSSFGYKNLEAVLNAASEAFGR